MKLVEIYTDGEPCFASLGDAVFARPLQGNRENMANGAVGGAI